MFVLRDSEAANHTPKSTFLPDLSTNVFRNISVKSINIIPSNASYLHQQPTGYVTQIVAHAPFVYRVDIARRQNPTSEQTRKLDRVCFVISIFKAMVLRHRCTVGKPNVESSRLEPIDQPIPVVGRTPLRSHNPYLIRTQQGNDVLKPVRVSLAIDTCSLASTMAMTLFVACRSIPIYFMLASIRQGR